MEKKVRKEEGLSVEELEAQSVELLPDREEMTRRRFSFNNFNVALASAQQGAVAQANQGIFLNY